MLKKILRILELRLELLEREFNKPRFTKVEKWNLETGKKFNDLINAHPISEEELLNISKTVCEFVQQTRLTNIDKYLFINGDKESPRLPYMLKERI